MPTPAQTISVADDPALLRIDGPIATITLNRPSAFNSIDLSIAKKLEQLSAEVEASDEIKVLVIEGEGRAFCAGGDLQTIGAAAATDTIAPVVGELLQHYHAFISSLRRMPKIVLASVHGSAAGAGLSLAFVADLCIATEDARFTPAYSKLGVSPDGGGTVGVVASVGPRRALQIFLAEDSFSAAQAYEWGLVAKVVPAADRFRDHMLWQPQHHVREINRKGNSHEEHHIDRQRRAQRLAEVDADEFRGHQQHQAVGRRDKTERQRRNQHHAHMDTIDVAG